MSDLTSYRLDQTEKRAEAHDARMGRVEDKLGQIQMTLAEMNGRMATKDNIMTTKDNIRNWGLVVIATVVASVIGVSGLLFSASSNQIGMFQAAMALIQTKATVSPPGNAGH